MMEYVQETDSKMIFPPLVQKDWGETAGNQDIMPLSESKTATTFGTQIAPDRIRGALATINDHPNTDVKQRAEHILNQIQKIITYFTCIGFDLNAIPKIHAFTYESDEAILLEWIFKEYRIGFSFEEIISESGWYLVTNKGLGEISASGFLTDDDLVLWLMNFIMAHS